MRVAPDLERVHSITSNFFFWQGLRWVPLGVALMLLSASYSPWWPLDPRWNDPFLLGLALAAFAASAALGSYYSRAYGRVRLEPGAHARRSRVKWLVVYPAMIVALVIDGALAPPVFVSGATWGAAILLYWWSTGRGRPHYVGAALLVASTSLWPLLGVAVPGLAMMNLFIGVIGAIYVVGGILDHLELRRALPPAPDADA